MNRAVVALVVLFVGCGSVTTSSLTAGEGGADVEQLGPDGGASDEMADSAFPDAMSAADGSAGLNDAGPDVDAPPSGPSCDQAARCASCAGYPCAAVIACARSGDAGAFPWQSCHNTNAGVGASVDGLHCSMAAACP